MGFCRINAGIDIAFSLSFRGHTFRIAYATFYWPCRQNDRFIFRFSSFFAQCPACREENRHQQSVHGRSAPISPEPATPSRPLHAGAVAAHAGDAACISSRVAAFGAGAGARKPPLEQPAQHAFGARAMALACFDGYFSVFLA